MIFHASIPSDEPERVASVLAEIWHGEAFRFPPWPGAFVAMAGDERGSTIEVYPRQQVISPGDGNEQGRPLLEQTPSRYACFHLAIATARSEAEIMAIGQREQWRTVRCSRGGFFEVIELWLENSLMIEVMTEPMQRDYQSNVNLNTWRWTKNPRTVQ